MSLKPKSRRRRSAPKSCAWVQQRASTLPLPLHPTGTDTVAQRQPPKTSRPQSLQPFSHSPTFSAQARSGQVKVTILGCLSLKWRQEPTLSGHLVYIPNSKLLGSCSLAHRWPSSSKISTLGRTESTLQMRGGFLITCARSRSRAYLHLLFSPRCQPFSRPRFRFMVNLITNAIWD